MKRNHHKQLVKRLEELAEKKARLVHRGTEIIRQLEEYLTGIDTENYDHKYQQRCLNAREDRVGTAKHIELLETLNQLDPQINNVTFEIMLTKSTLKHGYKKDGTLRKKPGRKKGIPNKNNR